MKNTVKATVFNFNFVILPSAQWFSALKQPSNIQVSSQVNSIARDLSRKPQYRRYRVFGIESAHP